MTSNPPSRPSVLVLGARGRFGRAAVTTFRDANWQVRAFVRPNKSTSFGPGIEIVEGDAFDLNAVRNAAREVDVIVHALNPPYPRWQQDLPRLTESLREAMEQAFRQAAGDGVHTVVLRAGDFIESARTGNWFDTYVTAKLDRGIAVYPGPLHQVHAWAYLPDMARAMVALAEREGDPTGFESFNFGGYNVTGAELVAAMEAKTGRPLKVRSVPWLAMRLIAPFVPLIREVLEMRYLWNVPHAIDGSRLQETLPNFRPTPLPEALDDVLPSLAASRAPNGTTGLVSAS